MGLFYGPAEKPGCMVKRMKVLYEAVTTFGPNRRKNQDNYYLNGLIKETDNEQRRDVSVAQYQMYALCDGMGGERSGDKAAELAVLVLREDFSDCKGIDLKNYIRKRIKESANINKHMVYVWEQHLQVYI